MPDCHSVSSRRGRIRVAASGLVGSDWRTSPQTQIRWGEDYIRSRYGSPCQAWAFWRARTYYGPLLAVVPLAVVPG